jgi:hypothetical protein
MSGVKVLRRGEDLPQPEDSSPAENPEVFCATLSTGQEICIRPMKASDIMWMETLDRGKEPVGDVQKSLKLVARLSTKTQHPITFPFLMDLSMPDLKIVTDLLAKASGTKDEEVDDFDPNF